MFTLYYKIGKAYLKLGEWQLSMKDSLDEVHIESPFHYL